jgi:bacterioferritin
MSRCFEVLNEALATELVCVLRYKRHYFTATGLNAAPVAAEFLQRSNEEQVREDLIAERIAIESYSELIEWLGAND